MTTHKRMYCGHCGVKYFFQASGEGASEYNDATYCPDCKYVILEALEKVPIRGKKVFVPSNDFTEEEFKKRLEESAGWPPRIRVFAGLYDNDGDYQCSYGLNVDGKLYQGTWWKKKGGFELRVETYREIGECS